MSASQDGSESVDQFLARIASVKESRDGGSGERTRRMEEDFLKNRKERQARRLERARSLSPSKTGPLPSTNARPSPAAARDSVLTPPVDFSPRASKLSRSNAVSARVSPTLEPKQPETEPSSIISKPLPPTSAIADLTRTGTLSWQQRPPRGDVMNRPRPLSSAGYSRPATKSDDENSADRPEVTRQQIAASLGAKDPNWFRQTQERGLGSAAFRKNQVEDTAVVEHIARSQVLPGMSKEGPRPVAQTPVRGVESSSSTIQLKPLPSPNDRLNREPSPTLPVISDVPKLVPSPQQALRQEPSSESGVNNLVHAGSILGGRPASPTKGLGGFVESAMMKRSDSVNKRWSVQAATGLKRGDSVAGMRPLSGMRSMHTLSQSRGSPRDDSPSPMPSSRPESRDGPPNVPLHTATPDRNLTSSDAELESNKPAALVTTKIVTPHPDIAAEEQLSRSPSKTLDPRRWSPTKSSWLESALLSQPEPPKMQPKKEEVPAWKATLQRNKSSRDLSPGKPIEASGNGSPDIFQDSRKTLQTVPIGKKPELKTAVARSSSQQSPPESDKISEVVAPSFISPALVQTKSVQSPPEIARHEPLNPVPEEKADKKPSPVLRPKPQTPPKTDFRATLRSRAPVQAKDDGAEPEFRSIFGKLKKAETQNYVAPDTLKTNILGGKAALNTTEGPQKIQRVDEFKQSILQKKEAMKTTSEQKKDTASNDMSSAKQESTLPEALARRKTLHKSTPSSVQVQSSPVAKLTVRQEPTKPPIANKPKPLASASASASSAEQLTDPKLTDPGSSAGQENKADVSKGEPQKLTSAPLSARKPEPSTFGRLPATTSTEATVPVTHQLTPSQLSARKPEPSTFGRLPATTNTEATVPMTHQSVPISITALPKGELPAGSRLASRLNPNLASLLTRGGSPQESSIRPASPEKPSDGDISKPAILYAAEAAKAEGELTHMTKGRARGPKRRAPKSQPAQATSSRDEDASDDVPQSAANVTTSPDSTPAKPIASLRQAFISQTVANSTPVPKNVVTSASKEEPTKYDHKSVEDDVALKVRPLVVGKKLTKDEAAIDGSKSIEDPAKLKTKPPVVVKSSEVRKVSRTLAPQQADVPTPRSQSSQFEIATDKEPVPKPWIQSKPRELPPTPKSEPQMQPTPRELPVISNPEARLTPRDLPPTPKPASTASPLTPSKSRVNTPKFAQSPVNLPSKPHGPKPTIGLGVTVKPIVNKAGAAQPPLTPPPENARKPPMNVKTQPHGRAVMNMTPLMNEYFSKPLNRQHLADFDAQNLLLRAKEQPDKIRSLNHNIWELNNDGKKNALSPGQEHILYEECMYLVTHSFQNDAGTKSSEVYLWCGDEVAEAAIEDAQLFCRKDAREHNVKLELIKQGKEPARFFQALGGILITRRNKASSLYMLRGRRHLGHIAFDEVDLTSSNLCPGFCYLISAKFGKLYLWSGEGSGADEVGCARLIGMDLGLTGEIEEVVDGKEPSSFWESFPYGKRQDAAWTEDWQSRAKHDCYPTTLYRVDLERPKSAGGFWGLRSASPPKPSNKVAIDLISPFNDRDLEPSNVYVLDAYRSIYVILNSQATSKSIEVVTALHLAQELAMLSPSVQDRSLLPTCNVVFGEPTADVKICFRKWSRALSGKADTSSACHKLEDVMDALKL